MRLLFGLILLSSQVFAQHIYWVEFTGKDTAFNISKPQTFLSEKAILRRQKFDIPVVENDLPVNASYIKTFQQKGFVMFSKSKWLNAVAVSVPEKNNVDFIKQFPFVKKATYLGMHKSVKASRKQLLDFNEMLKVIEAKNDTKRKKANSNFYGKTFRQINMLHVDMLHKLGFEGQDINIAVIDAGFNNADTLPVFQELISTGRLKGTHDFVQGNDQVFEDDDHGTAVLSCMAGYLPYNFVGTAPMANYYLLRSENANSEMPIEETFWIEAIEYADSLGIDIVNSSLGYNEFDDMSQNFSYKDLDGKTSMISQAAAMAVQKGIVVVVSAGNEGDEDWKFICVPADVAEVITVGGVTPNESLAGFSSIGPTADKRIKPDIMAQGDNVWVASSRGVFYQGDGTSYSSPVMAGAIACLMQAHPQISPKQLMNVLHTSGSNYSKPDKYMGYGIPDLQLAHFFLLDDTITRVSAHYLNDNRIHIALVNAPSQKITIVVKNEIGEIVHSENVSLKEVKATRFALKKIKDLKSGMYSLHITTDSGPFVQTVNIP
jgi:serine protease AprX